MATVKNKLATVLLLMAITSCSSTALKCDFSHSSDSISLTVSRSDEIIFKSEHVAVHIDNTWYSFGQVPTSHESLSSNASKLDFISINAISGTDKIGTFQGVVAKWTAKTSTDSVPWETSCMTYSQLVGMAADTGAVVFESTYPDGAMGTSPMGSSTNDGVIANFPAFTIASDAFPNTLSWQGEFVGASHQYTVGAASGPNVFFGNTSQGCPMVTSPLNHFKVASAASSFWDGSNLDNFNASKQEQVWIPGTLGTVTSVPKGFSHQFLAFSAAPVANTPNECSVTHTLSQYGALMQRLHNTTRVENDVTVTKLQYQTDNGGQYCFCKEDCDTKLLSVKEGLKEGAPALGSLSFQGGWWDNKELHTKYCAPWCVSSWEPNTTKFPSGAEKFKKAMDMPFQLYAPYFCMDTNYTKKFEMLTSNTDLPGCGSYNFKTPSPSNSEEFYTWFMEFGQTEYGMTSFEPDFMHQNFICVPDFIHDVSSAATWMNGMAAASKSRSLAMQWCMATPSDVLMALDYPTVTNFRVSTDYFYGRSWDIGLSSLLIWSLGALPSKDTFWTSDQRDIGVELGGCPGNGCPSDHTQAGSVLHSMLALFSTGPVGFSDAANRSDKALLNRMALQDGTLVKPSKPITASDRSIASGFPGYLLNTFSGPSKSATWAEVWGWYVLAHQIKSPVTVMAADLYPTPNAATASALLWHDDAMACKNNSMAFEGCVSNTMPVIALSSADEEYKPRLFVATKPCSSGFAVVGALDFFASLSQQLFQNIECTATGVEVSMAVLQGHESVIVTLIKPSSSPSTSLLDSKSTVHAFSASSGKTYKF